MLRILCETFISAASFVFVVDLPSYDVDPLIVVLVLRLLRLRSFVWVRKLSHGCRSILYPVVTEL